MSKKMAHAARYLFMSTSCCWLVACISTTTGDPVSNPSDTDAAGINYQLGIEYYQKGNYQLARDRLILSTELDPKRPIVWSTLATTYEQLDNLRLAEEAHNKALKTGPNNFDVLNSYAVFLCRQQRYDAAEKQFERSIKARTNDNPELMMTNAGVCLAQRPDYPKAESYFRRALERRPDYGEALLQMALLKHQTADDLTARAFIQRYLSTNPGGPGSLYLCVLIEDNLGDVSAKTECSNSLLRDYPDSVESQRILQN